MNVGQLQLVTNQIQHKIPPKSGFPTPDVRFAEELPGRRLPIGEPGWRPDVAKAGSGR
jgi:hypothetical protein